jgi:polar amino acid transport system substrate-binding protein
LIAPAEPIGEPSVVLVVLKDNPWHFESISSLKGIRLGAIDGYTYWDALDEYIKVKKEPAVIHFSGEKPLVDAIGQLRAGKIDAMPETLPVFVWTIKNMGLSLSDFWVVYKRQNEPIYLAFAKTDEGRKYSKLFDAGVRKLRASGELAAMLKSYGLTDWK